MYLHIKFKDGSNPYIFYGKNWNATREECYKELDKWSKNYKLTLISQDEKGMYYLAEDSKPLKLF
jgi:hypothetical protein